MNVITNKANIEGGVLIIDDRYYSIRQITMIENITPIVNTSIEVRDFKRRVEIPDDLNENIKRKKYLNIQEAPALIQENSGYKFNVYFKDIQVPVIFRDENECIDFREKLKNVFCLANSI